jgi:hypothetical protein
MAKKYFPKTNPGAAKKAAEAVHAQLLEHVQNLVTSDNWPKLLQAMTAKNGTELSRFSFNNMLLLMMQMPTATAVVTYDNWQTRGRQVIKGQKALRVIAPITIKDPRDENKTQIVGFRAQAEFDVSQTEPMWQNSCEPMFITPSVRRSSVAKPLQGDAPEKMWEAIQAQITEAGYTVDFGHTGKAMGYTDPKTKTVMISSRSSRAQACKTAAHELGHILADHVDDLEEYQEHRGAMETVAESFAFMVCNYYNLDSAQYSAPYISTWAGRDPEEILTKVQKAGTQVLSMYRAFVKSVEAPDAEKIEQVAA